MQMNKDWIPGWVWSFSESFSHSVVSNPLQPSTITCPTPLSWKSLDKDMEMGSHYFFQGIFLTQGLTPGLLHCRQIWYCLEPSREAPKWVCCSVTHRVWLFVIPWTATHQASLSLSPGTGVCPSSSPLNQWCQGEYSTKKRRDATYYIFLRSVCHLWGTL